MTLAIDQAVVRTQAEKMAPRWDSVLEGFDHWEGREYMVEGVGAIREHVRDARARADQCGAAGNRQEAHRIRCWASSHELQTVATMETLQRMAIERGEVTA